MKYIFKILFLILVIAAVWYQFGGVILNRFIPCKNPIVYTLGTFDTKFGISKSYFLSALSDAEAIWEKPQGEYKGKELFQYKITDEANEKSDDFLKINLVYDYRQEATSKLASLGIVVEDNKASYEDLKSKLAILKTRYEKEKNAFEARLKIFNQRQLAYEAEVKSWNKKGGAPKDEYNKLEQERLALNSEAEELQKMQKSINEMVEEINALVVVLNRLVGTLNLSVGKFNAINVARGESFEEGVYTEDGVNKEIDIYEFSSRAKLVRVLAHELGHALGLGHVVDPKAIMYELNQGNNQTLTTADLDALKAKCGVK